MARYLPPYLHDLMVLLEKELLVAQKKEIKAKKSYESAMEYRKLCEQKLNEAKEEAKKNEQNKG